MADPLLNALGQLHRTLFSLRFATVSRRWGRVVATARPKTRRIVVSGFFNEALGIGQSGVLSAQALERLGYEVRTEDLRPFDRKLLSRKPEPLPHAKHAQAWLIAANAPETKIALFGHDYATWKDLYRIAYWTWESSLAPADWVETAPWLHEIWVPSRFVKDSLGSAFIAAGHGEQVPKLKVFPYPVKVPDSLAKTEGAVTAVTLFDPRSHFERKNPAGAIAAWIDAFPHPTDKARLIVKTLSGADAYPAFATLTALAQGRPDIEFRLETLSDADTLDLIASCDVLISLHRGEGFGLTLAEAMARGLSVLATGWSGNTDFMTRDNAMPVPFSLVLADPAFNGPQARWADPDLKTAATDLRRLVDDVPLRQRLGQQARQDIAQLVNCWEDIFPKA
jgi:glycosyltransferase involved in cell wall biosynthesis